MRRSLTFPVLLTLSLSALLSSAADPNEESLPTNLGTRKTGVDWPSFLGPTGDGKSPEKGILKERVFAGSLGRALGRGDIHHRGHGLFGYFDKGSVRG